MLAYKSLGGSAASDHLDLMRGGAAILVMLGHLRNLFLVSPEEVVSHAGVLVKFVYLISGFSHFAVMIFFALSGFLVGGSVIRGRMEGKWSWSAYFATRLTRLWIVLIPALLLGAIWDHSGILAFGTSGIYGGQARADVGIAAVAPGIGVGLIEPAPRKRTRRAAPSTRSMLACKCGMPVRDGLMAMSRGSIILHNRSS